MGMSTGLTEAPVVRRIAIRAFGPPTWDEAARTEPAVFVLELEAVRREPPACALLARPRASPSRVALPPATNRSARLANDGFLGECFEFTLDALLELGMEAVSGGLNKSSASVGLRSATGAALTTVGGVDVEALTLSSFLLPGRLDFLTVPPPHK